MIQVERSEVPAYLKKGEFFTSLSEEDDGSEIEVPDGVMKLDTIVKTEEDLVHLLRSLRYWLVSTLPDGVFEFVAIQSSLSVDVLAEFGRNFPFLPALKAVRDTPDNAKMPIAIRYGSMEVIRWLIANGQIAQQIHMCAAARWGHVHVLQFLRGLHNIHPLTAENAAQGGHLECLKFALEHGCARSKKLMVDAVEAGSVPCLRYLVQKGCTFTQHLAVIAAKQGHLGCLQFAHEQNCPWGPTVTGAAARRGHLNCLQYLREHGCVLSKDIAEHASLKGHASCLEYVLQHGCTASTKVLQATASAGRLSCLKVLVAAGVKMHAKVCTAAASNGHLECLKFLHEAGCPWDVSTCQYAASGYRWSDAAKKLLCLKYAHEHGCPWDEQTTLTAASGGSLEALRYVHENGCPWPQSACTAAAQFQQEPLPFLQYAHEHGRPWDKETTRWAAFAGKIDALRFLHEHGCPWDASTCTEAAGTGQLACLQYAHEHGCPWDESTILRGCARGRWACVQYAYEHGCPWNVEACAEALKMSSAWGEAPPSAALVHALSVPPDRAEQGADLKFVKREGNQYQAVLSASIKQKKDRAHAPPNMDEAALLLNVAIKRESDTICFPWSEATLLSNASTIIKIDGQSSAPPAGVALPLRRGIKRERDVVREAD